MKLSTMLKSALALGLGFVVGTAVAGTDVPAYGVTFESAVSTEAPLNDQAYTAGHSITEYGDAETGIGWFAESEDDTSAIAGDGNQYLKLNTESGTLTNKLASGVAEQLNAAIAGTAVGTEGAYFEFDAKFVASDSLDAGITGGQDDTKLALYAYYNEDANPPYTNLVVFHRYYDSDFNMLFTNDVTDIAIDTEVLTHVRIDMTQVEDDGTMRNAFTVTVGTGTDAQLVETANAYDKDAGSATGSLFLTAEDWVDDIAASVSSLAFKGTGDIDNIAVGTVTGETPAPTIIKIGDTEYESISAAIAAATAGDVLKLQEAGNGLKFNDPIVINKDITLDLGGYTLNCTNDALWAIRIGDVEAQNVIITNGSINAACYGVRVDKGSEVVLADVALTSKKRALQLTAESEVLLDNADVVCNLEIADEPAVYVTEGSVFTVDADSAVVQTGNGVAILGYGNTDEITVNVAGAVSNTFATAASPIYAYAICGNGNDQTAGFDLNILDGADIYAAQCTAIYFPCVGSLNIGEANVTGAQGVYVKAGATAVVDGATITATGAAKEEYNPNSSGDRDTGDAFVVDQTTGYAGVESVSISGGTFESANGYAVATYAAEGQQAVTNFVSAGSFKGGKGNANTDAVLAQGKQWGEADEDGFSTVENIPATPVATVITLASTEPVEYTDLHQALVDGSAAGSVVELIANVDLADVAWEPVAGFNGTFDGKGFIVSNLTVTAADVSGNYAGLFTQLSSDAAVVRNLTFENVSLHADNSEYLGTIVGHINSASPAISNITVCGKIDILGKKYVGGIAGFLYFGGLVDCHVDGGDASESTIATLGKQCGGLNGTYVSGSDGNMTCYDCTVKNVTITGPEQLGGLTGRAFRLASYVNCSVEDVIIKATKSTSAIGGLIGDVYNAYGHGRFLIGCSATDVSLQDADGATVTYTDFGTDTTIDYLMVSSDAEAENFATFAKWNYGFTAGTFTDVGKDGNMVAVLEANCAEGYEVVDNGDDTYTVREIKADPTVIRIASDGETTVEYTDLHLALVEAVNGDTVKLLSDIDLAGVAWEPVENFYGTVIDGAGYGIKNLTVSKDGTYVAFIGQMQTGNNNKITVRDLTFDNASVTATGAYDGIIVAEIANAGGAEFVNVTITNSVLNGVKYVGAINGHTSTTVTYTNVKVVDSTISASDAQCGALFGYSEGAVIATNVEISGNTITGNKTGALCGRTHVAENTYTNLKIDQPANAMIGSLYNNYKYFVGEDTVIDVAEFYDVREGTGSVVISAGTWSINPEAGIEGVGVATGYEAVKTGDVWVVQVKTVSEHDIDLGDGCYIDGIAGTEGAPNTIEFTSIDIAEGTVGILAGEIKTATDGSACTLTACEELGGETFPLEATIEADADDATKGIITITGDISEYDTLFFTGIGPAAAE